jgi:anaerobic ribonucleoside-triphosphate reductase activating protein
VHRSRRPRQTIGRLVSGLPAALPRMLQPGVPPVFRRAIHDSRRDNFIEGITLLGGEPFAHAPGAISLARDARACGLSVMVFSGYTLDQIRAMSNPAVSALLELTDILVDGPYIREKPETLRRWIGSSNQCIHFLSDRYKFDDQWRQRNTLEIRVDRSGISVNGFPANDAAGLWKGWKRKRPVVALAARVDSK